MMNKLLCFASLILTTLASVAQVKIGNNPNTININSLLELESTNKGFLPPRVALNSVDTVAPLTLTTPSGMLVYSFGGILPNGYYTWNGVKWLSFSTSANARNNFVLVKTAADFPAAVGGVRTLSAGTLYEINGTITLTDMINLNGCYIIGQDLKNDKLIYTPTTGELFTGGNGGSISNLILSATGVGAKLFNIDGGGSVTKSLFLNYVSIQNCNNIGLIKGMGGTVVFEKVVFVSNTNGITLQNIGDFLASGDVWTPTNSNTFLKFTGTFGTIMMLGCEIQTLAAFSATAIDITGITSITNAASIKSTMIVGTGTYVTGGFTNKWEVEAYGLPTEKDDVASGNFYISSAATTTFTAVNTPTKVLGTTNSTNLFRVSSPTNNRLTYIGYKPKKFLAICSLSFIAGGSNKVYSFFLTKNGVKLDESEMMAKSNANSDQNAIPVSCTISLAPNDYVEVWVKNNTDVTSITIAAMNFAIK